MKNAALLILSLATIGFGLWILQRPSHTPNASVTNAPLALATDTSTHTQIFISKPTVQPAPALPAPAQPPANFQETIEKTQAGLPTVEQIRKLKPAETHKTPLALFQAGTDIGKVAEAIEKDPSLAPEGLDFYGKCARRQELSVPVRALCLGNLRDLAKKTDRPIDEEGVSLEIRRLADKLND